MGQRLDKKTEEKLLQSLLETLNSNYENLVQAYHLGDHIAVKKIGHQLHGNSGALYFRLQPVIEIGKQLDRNSFLSEEEYKQTIDVLQQAIDQLKAIAAEGI